MDTSRCGVLVPNNNSLSYLDNRRVFILYDIPDLYSIISFRIVCRSNLRNFHRSFQLSFYYYFSRIISRREKKSYTVCATAYTYGGSAAHGCYRNRLYGAPYDRRSSCGQFLITPFSSNRKEKIGCKPRTLWLSSRFSNSDKNIEVLLLFWKQLW